MIFIKRTFPDRLSFWDAMYRDSVSLTLSDAQLCDLEKWTEHIGNYLLNNQHALWVLCVMYVPNFDVAFSLSAGKSKNKHPDHVCQAKSMKVIKVQTA